MRNKVLLPAIILIPWLAGLAAAAPAAAENTTFKQLILPMDCVFTVINAGTGELQYLTPKECGVVISPPSQPASNSSAGQPAPSGGFFSLNVPVSGKPGGGQNSSSPAWQPVFSAPNASAINDVRKTATSSRKWLTYAAAAASGAIILAVLLILLFDLI